MLKKVLFAMTVSAIMTASALAIPLSASASSQDIISAAKAEIPTQCVMYGYKEDDGKGILNFRDNENYLDYDVKVDANTNKVLEVVITGSNISGSTNIVKTVEDIRNIILEAYPDAKDISIKTETEGNNTHYEAEFTTAKYRVEAKMNPVTGSFAQRELEYF